MNCTMSLNLSERSFALEGDQGFVEKHYIKLLQIVQETQPVTSSPSVIPSAGLERDALNAAETGNQLQCTDSQLAPYISEGIFYIDSDTKMPVIQTTVPGNNRREQMRNVALILLYASDGPMNSSYIKEQCQRQSCLDGANFSKAYEKDKKNFIKKGKPGSRDWSLELSIPGKRTAKELLDSMMTK